jgi:hypothetical protein
MAGVEDAEAAREPSRRKGENQAAIAATSYLCSAANGRAADGGITISPTK